MIKSLKRSLLILTIAVISARGLPLVYKTEHILEKRLIPFLFPVFYSYGAASAVQSLENKLFPDNKLECILDYATHIKSYPNVDTPAFYNECCFGDEPYMSDVGEFLMEKTRLGSGKLSAVVVPRGYKVTLFRGKDYKGDKLELTETSVVCLSAWKGAANFNDQISSVKVERIRI